MSERRPEADNCNGYHKADRYRLAKLAHSPLQFAFRLHHEPGRSQQSIRDQETDADEQAEGRKPAKQPARIGAFPNLEAVDECAERYTLREGRNIGTPGEGFVPEGPVRLVCLEAKLATSSNRSSGERGLSKTPRGITIGVVRSEDQLPHFLANRSLKALISESSTAKLRSRLRHPAAACRSVTASKNEEA